MTGYLYRFGAWLMHMFMVQVEVQVGTWLVALVYGTNLLQAVWYRLVHG